MIECHI